MEVKFTSSFKTNQNINLRCLIDIKANKNKSFLKYKYNNILLFEYKISILNSEINLIIIPNVSLLLKNTKFLIGSFIYELSRSYNVTKILFKIKTSELVQETIFEFMQKDFLYNKYLNKSKFSVFKTNFKLNSKYKELLSSINYLKMLVSEPSNILYPENFVKIVKKETNPKKVNVKIFDKKQIEKIGLRCLLSVNQGSARQPRVITFNKKNHSKNIDILFVGKGVCFDTGGISIKPSAGMEDMKWDMAGAGVVCALMKYLGNINTSFSYAGIVGLVENMPDGEAYKPGDIIKSYKGINVEVLNTDAEGRLVLADIITYACDIFKPKVVIDFATLTGAIMIALGQHYAGLYSNDDKLSEKLYQSGIFTNEKVWRMPLHEDFDKELNSPFVDLKNISNSRFGGSVTAAQFLKRFVPENTKWAHLDIAGVTWKPNGDQMNSKGATGFGLTLIANFIDRYF